VSLPELRPQHPLLSRLWHRLRRSGPQDVQERLVSNELADGLLMRHRCHQCPQEAILTVFVRWLPMDRQFMRVYFCERHWRDGVRAIKHGDWQLYGRPAEVIW
jgi:hypothetical protein